MPRLLAAVAILVAFGVSLTAAVLLLHAGVHLVLALLGGIVVFAMLIRPFDGYSQRWWQEDLHRRFPPR